MNLYLFSPYSLLFISLLFTGLVSLLAPSSALLDAVFSWSCMNLYLVFSLKASFPFPPLHRTGFPAGTLECIAWCRFQLEFNEFVLVFLPKGFFPFPSSSPDWFPCWHPRVHCLILYPIGVTWICTWFSPSCLLFLSLLFTGLVSLLAPSSVLIDAVSSWSYMNLYLIFSL